MKESWLVVGGGFKGIIGAYLLASQGKKVTLVERGNNLGGVLNSAYWQGFYLDKGCHLFSNDSDATTEIVMDILQGKFESVSVSYASITNQIKTEGMAIPNLASYGKESVNKILCELIACLNKSEFDCETLQEKLTVRYGNTACHYLEQAVNKMYGINSRDLDADAWGFPFRRIKFLDDSVANILKESPILDNKIAVSSQSDPMKFVRNRAKAHSFRVFYPKEHGTRGFCEQARQRLTEMGVNILLNAELQKIDFSASEIKVSLADGEVALCDRILWTAGIEVASKFFGCDESIKPYIHNVPMILYYFAIAKNIEGKYGYVHNFDAEDLFFRASVPGSYGKNNCPEGLSYVCCEIPTKFNSSVWNNPEKFTDRVWQEIQEYQVVKGDRYKDVLTVKIPTSYKLQKVGYKQAIEQINRSLSTENRLIGADKWDFSKTDIIQSLNEILESELV